jgi:glutaredoxin
MKIEVHSKTICPYCQMTKQFLSEHRVPYEEHVYDDDAERQSMYDRFGLVGNQRTVPQIFVVEDDGSRTRIGGYNDLRASDLMSRVTVGDFNMDF